MMAILTGVSEVMPHCGFNLNFSVCNIENLFMYLFAMHISPLEKCVFRSSEGGHRFDSKSRRDHD